MSALDALRAALAKGNAAGALAKADTFTQSPTATTGLTEYDLEPVAKEIYPVYSPLRNRIPRVGTGRGTQANWKAITGINTTRMGIGVTEGARGGLQSASTADYFAAFRGLGLEDSVTFEAEMAAEGFDDLRARAQRILLQATMEAEERVILGGNTLYAIGQTPTPTVTSSSTGGSLGAQTVSVICVALTYDGLQIASVADGVPQVVSRTNADGTTTTYNGGSAIKSAAGSVTISTGASNSVTATVTPLRGAYGYAWFAGAAGSEQLQTITTTSSVTLASLATGNQAATALNGSDHSRNDLVHDGMLGFIGNSANGSYYHAAEAGSGLTGDGSGGIVEFDNALQAFWDNHRLTPSRIIIASQEMVTIRKKILAGATAANSSRFVFNVEQGQIVGGGKPKGYLNPFVMGGAPPEIELELHPYMPAGTVMFVTDKLPYPQANIANLMQIRTRRDYYSIEWPRTRRAYVYGVYTDQVLQHYFMPSLGVITNLAAA